MVPSRIAPEIAKTETGSLWSLVHPLTRPRARIVAVASGKGGVGKTILTANLAVSLAQSLSASGGKVVAVDLDIGCGNLNTCLGVRASAGTVNDFLLEKKSLNELLTATDQGNLQMICGSYSGLDESRLEGSMRQSLIGELTRIDADFVLLDLGAGSSPDVMDFFLRADDRLIVVTPEATSLHNAYLFAKSATLRSVLAQLEKEEFLNPVKAKVQQMLESSESPNLRTLIQELRTWDLYSSYVLAGIVADLDIKFVVNMYRGGADKEHLLRFHQLLYRHLCCSDNVEYLGFVHYDRSVPRAVQSIEPLLQRYPGSRAARDIRALADHLETRERFEVAPLNFPSEPWWSLARLMGR